MAWKCYGSKIELKLEKIHVYICIYMYIYIHVYILCKKLGLSLDLEKWSFCKKHIFSRNAHTTNMQKLKFQIILNYCLRMSVTIHTDLGDLKIELYCQQCPKTCENFLALCASGQYDGTTFHRNIPGFMVQGGDPSGSGKGGESIWGGCFEDEIHDNLRHNQRGVVSMANSGPNTNKVCLFFLISFFRDYFQNIFYSKVVFFIGQKINYSSKILQLFFG